MGGESESADTMGGDGGGVGFDKESQDYGDGAFGGFNDGHNEGGYGMTSAQANAIASAMGGNTNAFEQHDSGTEYGTYTDINKLKSYFNQEGEGGVTSDTLAQLQKDNFKLGKGTPILSQFGVPGAIINTLYKAYQGMKISREAMKKDLLDKGFDEEHADNVLKDFDYRNSINNQDTSGSGGDSGGGNNEFAPTQTLSASANMSGGGDSSGTYGGVDFSDDVFIVPPNNSDEKITPFEETQDRRLGDTNFDFLT